MLLDFRLHHFIACLLLLEYVFCLNLQHQKLKQRGSSNGAYIKMINSLKMIINEREDGRRYGSTEFKKNYLLDTLKRDIPKKALKILLRQQETLTTENPFVMPNKDVLSAFVEDELRYALAKKSSALFDRPTLQKSGKQDFLVIHPGDLDPFVTVIPNDIFYNHEKSCVNWLEDCNARGIRSRLLQKIGSPFV